MFRQCDLQQDNRVMRGWIPARKAIKDTKTQVRNQTGLWTIIRTHGYNAVDEGFVELGPQFVRKTIS